MMISNMKNPLPVLRVFGIKRLLCYEMPVDHFDLVAVFKNQVSESCRATGFGEAHRLPAYEYDLVGRCATDTVGIDRSRQWFATQLNAATPPFFGSLPKQLCEIFEHVFIEQL